MTLPLQGRWRLQLRLRVLLPLALLALTLLLLAAWLFSPRGEAVTVARRQWRLEIEVERLRLEAGSDACDQVPADARDVIRRPGNFSSTASAPGAPMLPTPATPERCRYQTLAWRTQWLARQQGEAGAPPRWPQPPLAAAEPGQAGSERLGRREAFYEVQLRAGPDRVWTCRLPLDRWQALHTGQPLRLPVDRWGVADCAGLG